MAESPRKRLFVSCSQSDGQLWYCGDVDDAHKGLGNLLQEDIRQLLSGELDVTDWLEELYFEVRTMTDSEVAANREAERGWG